MGVSIQLHAPAALPLGKEPLIPIDEIAGWAQELLWTSIFMFDILTYFSILA